MFFSALANLKVQIGTKLHLGVARQQMILELVNKDRKN